MSGGDGSRLDYLRHRDELFQVMYWMLGEGLGDEPGVAQLESFVGLPGDEIVRTLRRMTDEGFVGPTGSGGYRLTGRGVEEGRRSFAEDFAALTHQAHGECAPDCTFCHGPDADPASCPSKRVSHAAAG